MKRRIYSFLLIAVLIFGATSANTFSQSGMGRMFHAMGDPYPRITHQVFAYIEGRYVDPERADSRTLLEGAFRSLETRFPPVIIDVEGDSAKVTVKKSRKTVDLSGGKTMLGAAKVLNELLLFVAAELEDVEEKDDIYYAALNGAVSELDPHSSVINPKAFKDFMIGTQGSFGGIGFVFGLRDGEMTIITPMEGTPASRQGLRSGDKILFIDGEPTINMPLDTAKWKMRGEPGEKVTLTISRDEWDEPRDLTFVREKIHVDSVESYTLGEEGGSKVLYSKVKNFQKATTDEVRKAVEEAVEKDPDLAGIILDLRNNPGGLLDQAIELSDGFMDSGTIVSTRGRNPEENEKVEAIDDEPISDRPLIVLINQGSASASEIVSAALHSERALLIGRKTFGKGSVQKLYPLPDRGALKLTIAQYLTPNDVSIQSIGVQPDIFVYSATVKEGRVRIGEPVKHSLEADLRNAFNEWGNATEDYWQQVQYLQPNIDDSEMEDVDTPHEQRRKSFSELDLDGKLERLGEDFLITLAREIILEVPEDIREGTGRTTLKEAALKALGDARKGEEDNLSNALSTVGVDWAQGPLADPSSLMVTVDDNLGLNAGETADLVVTVKNLGDKPAHRVWGRTDSENPLVNSIDLAFGKIEPGEEKSWTTKVKIPKSIPSRWDPIKVTLHSGDSEGIAEGEGSALARQAKVPRYSYNYKLKETNEDQSLSGNCVIDKGDTVSLDLSVENKGEGTSRKTEVNIRTDGSTEKVYLKAARHSLEEFNPGERRDAPMLFDFKEGDEEGRFKVIVTVSDTDYGTAMTDELLFKEGDKCIDFEARIPPSISYAKLPPLRTTDEKITITANLSDDEEVKEFYAYLGDKKIYYERAGGTKETSVTFDVNLAEGTNFLLMTTADSKEILTTNTFHIFRATEGEELALKSATEK